MTEVFVSYRSSDASTDALWIADRLDQEFGFDTAFLDHRSIPLGADFRSVLWDALENCAAVVAVIGPDWLQRDSEGVRRIDQENDFVRQELALALARDIKVVPVLVRGAAKVTADNLPDDLRTLADRQYLSLHRRSAGRDLTRLVEDLAKITGLARAGIPAAGTPSPAGGINFFGRTRVGGDIVNGNKTEFHRGRR